MNFFVFIVLISCLGYLYVKWVYAYWRRKKVIYVEPKFPVGTFDVGKNAENSLLQMARQYEQYKNNDTKSPILGLYMLLKPFILVVDLNLLRRIFITDFQYFTDRGMYFNEKDDPLSANLVSLEYDKWRPLRTKLTPTFTSGKMKFMFPTIISVSNELVECLNAAVEIDSEVEIYEWLAKYTTDVIGTCIFGLECNSLKDPQSEFRRMGRKTVAKAKFGPLARAILNTFPKLGRAFRVKMHHDDVIDFYTNIIKDTIRYREENNVQRNDFMNILIELKNAENETDRLTVDEIAAQAYSFFTAGYETTSTTVTFCLYELALEENVHIQKTLRKHPPAAVTARRAVKNYQIPDSGFIIPEGMGLTIPIYGIHHDSEYYPNPEKFDPDRFEPEQAKLRPSCSYIPFGDGQRNCIGLRFGLLQAKIGLVKLLQNFEFSACANTMIPLKYNKKKSILTPDSDIRLEVSHAKKA